MTKDIEFTVAHAGSTVDHPPAQIVTRMAAGRDEFEDEYNVRVGKEFTDEELAKIRRQFLFERFQLASAGQKIKTIDVSYEVALTGVLVTFEDGKRQQAGQLSSKRHLAFTFEPDEVVTETAVRYEMCQGMVFMTALQFKTSHGREFVAEGYKSFKHEVVDTFTTKGALVGVYGLKPGYPLFLGLILRLQEDVEYHFTNVTYQLDAGNSLGDRLISLKEQTIDNSSSATVSTQVKFSHNYTTRKDWSNKAGLKAGVKTKIEGKIPSFASVGVEVSGEVSYDFGWGEAVSESRTDEWTATVSAPPHSHLRGRATVTESTVEIPYKADLLITRADGSTETIRETSGVYRGVNISDFRVNVEDVSG